MVVEFSQCPLLRGEKLGGSSCTFRGQRGSALLRGARDGPVSATVTWVPKGHRDPSARARSRGPRPASGLAPRSVVRGTEWRANRQWDEAFALIRRQTCRASSRSNGPDSGRAVVSRNPHRAPTKSVRVCSTTACCSRPPPPTRGKNGLQAREHRRTRCPRKVFTRRAQFGAALSIPLPDVVRTTISSSLGANPFFVEREPH